jgi:hypothetical protein
MGFVRSDIWRRYGALGNVGKSNQDIRAEIAAAKRYSGLPVDGTIRNETTKNIIDDVLLYKAAAMVKVRRAIFYTLLRNDEWQTDNFLHRQMRKHFRHGKSSVANPFIVRSDRQSSKVVDKYGDDITLTTTSSGKAVDLTGRNLRIIAKDGHAEVHYATEKGDGRECGAQVIGIDKGYTEAFTDSDGQTHGQTFGTVLTEYSDKASATGKSRNKLHALEKSHRVAGRITKADRIKANNLGPKKIDARRENAQDRLRDIAYQAAHSKWKKFNRGMSSWAKGVLADSLDSVCTQRGAEHSPVNSTYTSQMDSTTGLLKGKRVGDKFYRENGDVLQADHNAALNVLARLGDREISRWVSNHVNQVRINRG